MPRLQTKDPKSKESYFPFYPSLNCKDHSKNYYKSLFILGIIYDLLYSNIFLFHALLFLILGKISIKIFKIVKSNLLVYLFLIILNILIYDGIIFTLICITNYQSVSLLDYYYKIRCSLLLNIIFGIISYTLKKRKINI